MEWMQRYPKKRKPAYSELLDYFTTDVRELFIAFDAEMRRRYNVYNKYHRFLSTSGWAYGYGRSYNCELLTVTVGEGCFKTLGISVSDSESLEKALIAAKKAYDDGFEQAYAEVCSRRREDQKERSQRRKEREKAQMDELIQGIDPDKFNKFKWCGKVSRRDLLQLYKGEASGMIDEALLEEIGLTFYLRCKQAKEARELMDKGQIVCHNCGALLRAGRVSRTGAALISSADADALLNCGCGHSYTYREYRRSCNAVNMPGGRATPIFEGFMQGWPGCAGAKEKMMLIDRLIHECHVTLMSGVKGRSVCVNLIEGTLKQISELITKLAYEANVNT